MKSRPLIPLLVAGILTAAPVTAQNLFDTDFDDAQLTTGGKLDSSNYAARIGEFFGEGSCYVIPFLIPNLKAGESFHEAELRVQLHARSEGANLPEDADLFGIGIREEPTVLLTDYDGNNAAESDKARLIQASFLTPDSEIRADSETGPFVTTSTDGGVALTAYLNSQYDEGKNAGKYVFLRISYSGPPPTADVFYSVLTQDADGIEEKPRLSYSTTSDDTK